jgi:uroporphyrinogen decarboxylase
MTGYERIENLFSHKPIDRIPVGEDFWGDTIDKWAAEGHIKRGESLAEHFDHDLDRAGLINWYADPVHGGVKLEENEDTVLILDGNGAKLRHHKHHASTPEHVDFLVKDRTSWDEHIKPQLLDVDRRRIPVEDFKSRINQAKVQQRHFSSDAFGPFELMQRLCGHEILLLNMALDPDWVKDMVMIYSEFNIQHWEVLFNEAGLPQSTWIAEDLGFKHKPFMSPTMFSEILAPGYKRMFDYLHSKGLKVIMHSCGYIEPLLPELIELGLDCLEAMEYKAGMDMLSLYRKFGDSLVYFGNIDVRVLESNERTLIDQELEKKILPVISNGGRYILHSDHSISPKIEYETYCYFIEKARRIRINI